MCRGLTSPGARLNVDVPKTVYDLFLNSHHFALLLYIT